MITKTEPVIFVHSLFRSGSTYFYNALKRTGLYHVYHEPFHEVVGTLPSAWGELTNRTDHFKALLRHDFLQGNYFDEYAHLLPSIKKDFNKNISFDSFFLDKDCDAPALKTYIDVLINGSLRPPVLQCTRTVGRIEWLRSNYLSKHIFLLRNPWDQWYSYRVDNYISATPRLIYSQPRLPLALQEVMEACEFSPLRGTDVGDQLSHCYSNPIAPQVDYFLFFGLWLYAFTRGHADCDVVLDMDGISGDQCVREEAERRLPDVGLNGVGLDDCNLHRAVFGGDEVGFYQRIEEQVLGIFGRRIEDAGSVGLAQDYLARERGHSFITSPEADPLFTSILEDATRLRANLLNTEQELARTVGSLNRSVSERDGQIVNLNRSVSERDGQIASLNQVATERDHLRRDLDAMERHANWMHTRIEGLLASHSWKVTRPLRVAGNLGRILRRDRAQLRPYIAQLARRCYMDLPLPVGVKTRIKSVMFTLFAPLLADTGAYKRWKTGRAITDVRNTLLRPVHCAVAAPTGSKLLLIDRRYPEPDKDAGSVTTFSVLKLIRNLGYDVTFIPDDLDDSPAYRANLETIGVECLNKPGIQSIATHLQESGSDYAVIFLFRAHVAVNYIAAIRAFCPGAKVILNTSDLHFVREERQARINRSEEHLAAAGHTRRLELDAISQCDISIVMSEYERSVLQQYLPSARVVLLPLYFIDICGSDRSFDARSGISFIGGYEHAPNVDAVIYFCSEIFPLVRAELPDVEFRIIGSNPTESVSALNSRPGVNVLGYVKDLQSELQRARLSVAPLRFGAGIKGKIASSLAAGLPCVATPMAVEGMRLADDEILIGNDPATIARQIVRLYSDRELWSKLSDRGITYCQRLFSQDVGRVTLKALLREAGMPALPESSDRLETWRFSDRPSYLQWHKNGASDESSRRLVEGRLLKDSECSGISVPGVCYVCGKLSTFCVDLQYALTNPDGTLRPNLRERLVCASCDLNNRLRASIHAFESLCAPTRESAIYVTERVTQMYTVLRQRFPKLVGSEFLGKVVPFGEVDECGVRNETLEHLTFADQSFDFILSFDVLEHVPDYRRALMECARCLKRGGRLLLSVPFIPETQENFQRARLSVDGTIEHLTEPEYHGDPLHAGGILCFHHFGWDLLEDIKASGFSEVAAHIYWSEQYGYMGGDQFLFLAIKSR